MRKAAQAKVLPSSPFSSPERLVCYRALAARRDWTDSLRTHIHHPLGLSGRSASLAGLIGLEFRPAHSEVTARREFVDMADLFWSPEHFHERPAGERAVFHRTFARGQR